MRYDYHNDIGRSPVSSFNKDVYRMNHCYRLFQLRQKSRKGYKEYRLPMIGMSHNDDPLDVYLRKKNQNI